MNFKLLLVILIAIAASPSMGQGLMASSSIGIVGDSFQNNELENGDGKQSTSLTARHGQPVSLASRVNQLEADFREKIEEINIKTSSKSQRHEKEIEKGSRKSDIRKDFNHETKVDKESDSVRLARVEEEIERLNHKFSLLDSKDKNEMAETDNVPKILNEKQGEKGKLKMENEDSYMRNEIDEMKGRLVRIETTIFNHEEDLMILNNRRSRRAVSPSTPPPCNFRESCAFDFKNKSHEEEISKPPTSCTDLRKSGHVLNGYYPIKNGENKVALVFCNFNLNRNLSSQANIGSETLIGKIEIKTKIVHFFVQRNTSFNYGMIPFQIERLNVGRAMNLSTGVFTAPVGGIYHFQFSGCKDESTGYIVVELHLNGKIISYAGAGKYNGLNNSILTKTNEIHVSLRLKMGDQVSLHKFGDAALVDLSGYPLTHFTGSLLEEDLEFV